MDMVKYWKTGEAIQAKVMTVDGVIMMQMEGEKYLFPGFPRGYLLFGKLSKLKHEIKNQIFNWAWAELESGKQEWEIVREIKAEIFPRIFLMLEDHKLDMVPSEAMVPAVREIHRAWTVVAPSKKSLLLRDTLTYILQEDDSYRFRVQWLVTFLKPLLFFGDPVKRFEQAMTMLGHAEIIGDMKIRVGLWKRTFMMLLRDDQFKNAFLRFCKEIDWNKVKLSKADKYFFRGKYFKVDLDKFEY
jgi:hypothetical protein